MRCTACGFENVAGASFCGECAAPLTSTVSCPSCGRTNPPKQKFCNGCGQALIRPADRAASADPHTYTPKHLAEKILTSRGALEGKRKQVTEAVRGALGRAQDAEDYALCNIELLDHFVDDPTLHATADDLDLFDCRHLARQERLEPRDALSGAGARPLSGRRHYKRESGCGKRARIALRVLPGRVTRCRRTSKSSRRSSSYRGVM